MNTLILCGGSGAHVGLALMRLHILGYALGFFDKKEKIFDFPMVFLVDQDAGDGTENFPTAWQKMRRLIAHHPGRHAWMQATASDHPPELMQVSPLPIGDGRRWYQSPNNSFSVRFNHSELLRAAFSERQAEIDYSKGMMASPAVGAALFALKELDLRGSNLNFDENYERMLKRDDRVVVVGSGIGGTGASVAPTLASQLAETGRSVAAIMLHRWFEFNEQGLEERTLKKAQSRNRIMSENAHSALQFYGLGMSTHTAAIPIGVPTKALLKRDYTSDLQQPILESYVHAIAAITAMRHWLEDAPLQKGLYQVGAVDSARVDGSTEMPGGTLQSLANQAATLHRLLETWSRILTTRYEKVQPYLVSLIEDLGAEAQSIGELLQEDVQTLAEQLEWLDKTLSIKGSPISGLTFEASSRGELERSTSALGIDAKSKPSNEAIASGLFGWTARWVRTVAKEASNGAAKPGIANEAYWPEKVLEGATLAAQRAGQLVRIRDEDRDGVLKGFVKPGLLSANGWPHPLASADFFRAMLDRLRPDEANSSLQVRQLELIFAGLMNEVLDLVPGVDGNGTSDVSLERLLERQRLRDSPTLGQWLVVFHREPRLPIAFSSPHTLFCPRPSMSDDDGNELWLRLWRDLGLREGQDWRRVEIPIEWGPLSSSIGQLGSWIQHQRDLYRDLGAPPGWANIFGGYQNADQAFGSGTVLDAFWRGTAIQVSLPTTQVGRWRPPAGTPFLAESDLAVLVPELERVTVQGIDYSVATFDEPESTWTSRGWWEEHLEELKRQRRISEWTVADDGRILIGIHQRRSDGVGRQLFQCLLDRSVLLNRVAISAPDMVVLEQENRPWARAGRLRVPDLPLRQAFIDLVVDSSGNSTLVTALRSGAAYDELAGQFRLQPEVAMPPDGTVTCRWTIRLKGRSRPMFFDLRANAQDKAHWMVWPGFRTKSAKWRSYYCYESSRTNLYLMANVLWLDPDTTVQGAPARVRVTKSLRDGGRPGGNAFPIKFRVQADGQRRHVAGPPVAMAAQTQNGDAGIFLIALKEVPESSSPIALAVDFGTSNSVAAVHRQPMGAKALPLGGELVPNAQSLSYHVSEDWGQVSDPDKSTGIEIGGAWLPTYTRAEQKGLVVSELILARKESGNLGSSDLLKLVPLTDFSIPNLRLGRDKLAAHLLADFKWDSLTKDYRGTDPALRRLYLGLFLELALAQLVEESGLPTGNVAVTFTYPLRSKPTQVEEFRKSLAVLLADATASTGIALELCDRVGIFDESRAGRIIDGTDGEVQLVADLGGGTLDVYVDTKLGIAKIPPIADSVRLGGNLLLQQIALQAVKFLPSNGGWQEAPEEVESRLRIWMRTLGSEQLLRPAPGDPYRLPELNLSGFASPSEANATKKLIDHYFRLIVEYLARTLAGYLKCHWFPGVPELLRDQLRITIQLRGNGWRLHYEASDYLEITEHFTGLVRGRLGQLWSLIESDLEVAAPVDDRYWEGAKRYAEHMDPKTVPACQAVGKAMPYADVKAQWNTLVLADLGVNLKNGERVRIPWYTRVPFINHNMPVQLVGIKPALPLDSDGLNTISSLPARQQGELIEKLNNEGDQNNEKKTLLSPVAALVWESLFANKNYHPGG